VVSGEKKKKRGVIEFLSSMAKRPTLNVIGFASKISPEDQP
jgi:hypothetical protein